MDSDDRKPCVVERECCFACCTSSSSTSSRDSLEIGCGPNCASGEPRSIRSRYAAVLALKNVMRRYVRPAAQAVGLSSLNWHSFRHSLTVQQRRNGTHASVLSRLLGHASTALAMDVYDHCEAGELRPALDQMLQDVRKSELATQ